MHAVASLDSSSRTDVPGKEQVSHRLKFRAPFETCLVPATMQALPHRSAAAPPSSEKDHRQPVPWLPAPKWRSPRSLPEAAASPRPHDTSVSAKGFAQLARTCRWVPARTAGLACGMRWQPLAPAGREDRKYARRPDDAAP